MARIGSVAAAPFVGDQFVSLYLGATRVPTVPGAPAISIATLLGEFLVFEYFSPERDGGSAITAYRFYVNNAFVGEKTTDIPQAGILSGEADESIVPCEPGDIVRMSAVNAVGEGPKSEPATVA